MTTITAVTSRTPGRQRGGVRATKRIHKTLSNNSATSEMQPVVVSVVTSCTRDGPNNLNLEYNSRANCSAHSYPHAPEWKPLSLSAVQTIAPDGSLLRQSGSETRSSGPCNRPLTTHHLLRGEEKYRSYSYQKHLQHSDALSGRICKGRAARCRPRLPLRSGPSRSVRGTVMGLQARINRV